MNNTNLRENNQVSLSGIAASNFRFSHAVWGENFFIFDLRVPRDSGIDDYIPVTVSERLFDVHKDVVGLSFSVTGQFRSYNSHQQNKSKLVLSLFANELMECEEDGIASINQIELIGFVCKPPIYRKTPLGREIADVLLAVNRPYGKSDYIPCIFWGRNARFAKDLSVGSMCRVLGRIQSRTYQKRIDDEHTEDRIAYEVSIMKVELLSTDSQIPLREE